jgi:hypothetical protein
MLVFSADGASSRVLEDQHGMVVFKADTSQDQNVLFPFESLLPFESELLPNPQREAFRDVWRTLIYTRSIITVVIKMVAKIGKKVKKIRGYHVGSYTG